MSYMEENFLALNIKSCTRTQQKNFYKYVIINIDNDNSRVKTETIVCKGGYGVSDKTEQYHQLFETLKQNLQQEFFYEEPCFVPDQNGNKKIIMKYSYGPIEHIEYGINQDNKFYYNWTYPESWPGDETLAHAHGIISKDAMVAALKKEIIICEKTGKPALTKSYQNAIKRIYKQSLWQRLKKIAKYSYISLLLMLLFFICFNLFGGPLCNNFKASFIEKSYASLELPPECQLLETTSFVGNTSGTGNHTEIWAGMLLYTTLSEVELQPYFSDFDIYPASTDWTSKLPLIRFSLLDNQPAQDNYYIIGRSYNAFTQMDLRGH